jgi:hypothetical protein
MRTVPGQAPVVLLGVGRHGRGGLLRDEGRHRGAWGCVLAVVGVGSIGYVRPRGDAVEEALDGAGLGALVPAVRCVSGRCPRSLARSRSQSQQLDSYAMSAWRRFVLPRRSLGQAMHRLALLTLPLCVIGRAGARGEGPRGRREGLGWEEGSRTRARSQGEKRSVGKGGGVFERRAAG